jgi:hypothetical protein
MPDTSQTDHGVWRGRRVTEGPRQASRTAAAQMIFYQV